jgi:hypothetical protein
MKTALRTVAAILAGLVVLFLLTVAVELFSAVVYPLPEHFRGTREEMCLHVARYPYWVLAVVVPAWATAAFASTWTAGKIGNLYSTASVGMLLLAALVINVSMLPYATWFRIASLLVIPAAVWAGIRLSVRHKTTGIGQERLQQNTC